MQSEVGATEAARDVTLFSGGAAGRAADHGGIMALLGWCLECCAAGAVEAGAGHELAGVVLTLAGRARDQQTHDGRMRDSERGVNYILRTNPERNAPARAAVAVCIRPVEKGRVA